MDCGALYESSRLGLVAFLGSLPPERLDAPVAATPAWSVRDVVAHVVGITADLNASYFGDGDPDAWTAAQVSARQGSSLADLVAEWDGEAPAFEDGLRLFGYEMGSHFVGDLLQHAQDIRAATGGGRISDDDALTVGLDHYLATFDRAVRDAGTGTVVVRRRPLGEGPVVASLDVERFELFRSLGGRRSDRQLRALEWDGDVERIIPLVSAYPMPADDLVD